MSVPVAQTIIRRNVHAGFRPKQSRRQRATCSPLTGLETSSAGQPNGNHAVPPANPLARISYFTTLRPKRRDTTNNTRNTAKRIFAKPAAIPARPANPNTAAINAITRNVIDQLNIPLPSFFTAGLWFFFTPAPAGDPT